LIHAGSQERVFAAAVRRAGSVTIVLSVRAVGPAVLRCGAYPSALEAANALPLTRFSKKLSRFIESIGEIFEPVHRFSGLKLKIRFQIRSDWSYALM